MSKPSRHDHENAAAPRSSLAMRKALVRLQLEAHRDMLQVEVENLWQPMHRMHDVSDTVRDRLKTVPPPVWAGGAALLLLLWSRRGGQRRPPRRSGEGGGSRLIRLVVLLAPLIRMVWSHRRSSSRQTSGEKPVQPYSPPLPR